MKRILIAVIAAVFLSSCGMQPGNVAALYWVRNINIEHWQENTHEGWSIPATGVEISHTRKAHGSYPCGSKLDYVDSKGKSHYSTRYCTNYDDWYTYRIWEWTPSRNLHTADNSEVTPYWQDDYIIGENERTGLKTEEYHVIVHTAGDTCDATTSQAIWSSLEIGESVRTNCNDVVSN